MLATQFQDFYNEICSEGQVPEDVREKIITYFLRIAHLFKNAEEINDKKGNVDKRYLKRIDLMISVLKSPIFNLFDRSLDFAKGKRIFTQTVRIKE